MRRIIAILILALAIVAPASLSVAQSSAKPLLGVNIASTDDCGSEGPESAKSLGGACVVHVFSGSPADHAGLVVGDIVIAINGKSVPNALALYEFVVGSSVGDSFRLIVTRGREELVLDGVLTYWQPCQ